jgi:hypothetical protein
MSFWYLATPYSKFVSGIGDAFELACKSASLLVRAGVPVFSPIAHSHPIALYGFLDPLDHAVWLPADDPFMRAACGLLVVKAQGWDESFGIGEEVKAFAAMGKPVRHVSSFDLKSKIILDQLRDVSARKVSA